MSSYKSSHCTIEFLEYLVYINDQVCIIVCPCCREPFGKLLKIFGASDDGPCAKGIVVFADPFRGEQGKRWPCALA